MNEASDKSKLKCQVSIVFIVEYPNQPAPHSTESANRREVWRSPDGTQHHSDWQIPNVFHRLLPLTSSVIPQNCSSGFRGFCNAVPNTLDIQDYFLREQTVFFLYSRNVFTPHCCKEWTIHRLWTFSFNGLFLMRLCREFFRKFLSHPYKNFHFRT